ncbi:MFS transporter [Planotetraspora thailandica]|uniref:MFS transporter n=1 Tax=Planotetraspora thailandica TaxID=487172 RepID=A0A8J3UV82_9ACTN|nr:MFS transporter [Planotetraspora thailandica]GII52007.1 MFS transporter [Planotetraspora thailandica]
MAPAILRNRDFTLYWAGVVLSQIGTRGTVAANFYQVYQLTGSVAYTGLVGAAQAVALILLSPLGGALADRLDRRRLLQAAQGVALLVAVALSWLTLAGQAEAWHVVLSVVLTTAAATFDQPARQALIPALVPRSQIGEAVALLNPSRELAVLVGPLLSGVLISLSGPGLMYVVDAVSYAVLVGVLATLRISKLEPSGERRSILGSIAEGARYIARRPLIYNLMLLDLSATVFSAYRVLLPALALDVLHVGATGYGVLSGAPSAGALIATYAVFRTVQRSRRQGRVLLVSTVLYGISAILLAHSPVFILAVLAALLLGAFDAMATTIRHAAVQIDTPDDIRGRVTAFYQMSSRGGPAIGDVVVGAVAGAIGPVAALTIGGLGPMLVAGWTWLRGGVVRSYTGIAEAGDEGVAEADEDPEEERRPVPGA